ncbi:MAG: hypothetical protein JSS09_00060, partial [Verrucomicrobia bacterium]|nr:hypothetical protein [Verrucomicrobiota bacterium]
NNTVIDTISNFSFTGSYGIAITPDGKHAYVTNSENSTVSVVSTESNLVEAVIFVGAEPLCIAITPTLPSPPSSPSSLKGAQKVNVLPFQKQFFNTLTWAASSSDNVEYYNIYRDSVLIGSVPSRKALKYTDYSINRNKGYTYGVAAVNSHKQESSIISVFIK